MHASSKTSWNYADSGSLIQVERRGRPLYLRGDWGVLGAQLVHPDGERSPILGREALQADDRGLQVDFQTRVLPDGETLAGTARIRNPTPEVREAVLCFGTSAQPSFATALEKVHLPLSLNGYVEHGALTCLGSGQLKTCLHDIGHTFDFVGHYLEPVRSSFEETVSPALLLIPLIDVVHTGVAARIALFGSPDQGWRFSAQGHIRGRSDWVMQTRLTLQPGEERSLHCWLKVHEGADGDVWNDFHRLAVPPDERVPDWLYEVRGSYMDFMAPGLPDGRRVGAYEADAAWFQPFDVGLATQHGYFPWWGDYLQPGRTEWTCMKGDAGGSVPHSLQCMKDRIALTRKQGARAGVYIHLTGFDSYSPLAPEFEDCRRLDDLGLPEHFPWYGPDMHGPAWFMSIHAEPWRRHLLDQTRQIMEQLNPDAIVIDETFAGIGYDHRFAPYEPSSRFMIPWLQEIRGLVKSYGEEKVVLTSDCDLTGFVLWADGEAGDHTYPAATSNEDYLRMPVRFLAPLGTKPWPATAWLFASEWQGQVRLANQTQRTLAYGNGWLEYCGLANLPDEIREGMLRDHRARNR